ncbi:MarC family protein [Variovorax sp. J22R115]|uniref:MarC family protein n=1 Tax=Variovorax sp. J22R115 TaxID=3053509 RepID=UPI0025773F85|nr:MarC family protein [Variovorax sp. J22R115]MDM0052472.1 MarC family protein [Variovorax sp. J22R115]
MTLFHSVAKAGAASAALALPAAAMAAPAHAGGYLLDAGQLFTLFFITLGPLKLLGPFAQATGTMDSRELRMLALKAAAIGIVALAAGGFIGRALAVKWMVPVGVLQFTAGLIFFLVALRGVLAQYEAPPPRPTDAAQVTPPGPMKIAFPMLVTPYGIAAVILLLTLSGDAERTEVTFAMLAMVMVLNLLAMIFVRSIMRPAVVAVLQVLGAVLGVMQVALSLSIMLAALYLLTILVR